MSIVKCGECGNILGDDTEESFVKPSECSICGSQKFEYCLYLSDRLEFHENLKGKTDEKYKTPGTTGKKKSAYEFQAGEERSVGRGKWVNKERVIDRKNDLYYEKVIDPDTKEIIHECEEPLSQHLGHGSDKLQKTKDEIVLK